MKTQIISVEWLNESANCHKYTYCALSARTPHLMHNRHCGRSGLSDSTANSEKKDKHEQIVYQSQSNNSEPDNTEIKYDNLKWMRNYVSQTYKGRANRPYYANGKALMMWNVGRGFSGRRKSDGQQIAYTGRQIVCAMFVRKVRARKPKWAHTCPTLQRLHISVECYSVFEWSFVLFFCVEEFGYPR